MRPSRQAPTSASAQATRQGVADTEIVSAFDYGVTDLISKTINQPADSAENNELSELTLSGSGFANEIVMVPNDDGNYSESFALTAPVSRLADEKESSLLTGGIRGLFANEVKMVNPSEKQLKDLGLQLAYAQITAVYPDETIEFSLPTSLTRTATSAL